LSYTRMRFEQRIAAPETSRNPSSDI